MDLAGMTGKEVRGKPPGLLLLLPLRHGRHGRASKRKRLCLSTDRAVCRPSASRSPFPAPATWPTSARCPQMRRPGRACAPQALLSSVLILLSAIPASTPLGGLGRPAAPSFRSVDKRSIACRKQYRFPVASADSQASCPTWMAGTSPAMTARGCIRCKIIIYAGKVNAYGRRPGSMPDPAGGRRHGPRPSPG